MNIMVPTEYKLKWRKVSMSEILPNEGTLILFKK